jgi:hypothetical protein
LTNSNLCALDLPRAASLLVSSEIEGDPMLKLLTLALGLATLAATRAAPQSQCVMNYQFFEFAIPHLDLEQCPKDVTRPGAFCRVTTANDNVHVFVFEEKGKQCLLAVKSYDRYEILVK